MKLLGKLYVSNEGEIYIHSRANGVVYLVLPDGYWVWTWIRVPHKAWRIIGDSYAKD